MNAFRLKAIAFAVTFYLSLPLPMHAPSAVMASKRTAQT